MDNRDEDRDVSSSAAASTKSLDHQVLGNRRSNRNVGQRRERGLDRWEIPCALITQGHDGLQWNPHESVSNLEVVISEIDGLLRLDREGARPQRCVDHHDLYAFAQARRARRGKPARFDVGLTTAVAGGACRHSAAGETS